MKPERRACKQKRIASVSGESLSWSNVSERLMGYGTEERSAEITASGIRIKLPASYIKEDAGFPDLLNGVVWTCVLLTPDYLVAIPLDLFVEFMGRLYQKQCREDGLSEESFFKLYVDHSQRVLADFRYRWQIHAHISKEIHHEGNSCPLVFQTRGPTIEIRTRGRNFAELRSAEMEVASLRRKLPAHKRPENLLSAKPVPQIARFAVTEIMKS